MLLGLVIALGSSSDNIVLPILSAVVLTIGAQLDRITIQKVKKIARQSPRVLEIPDIHVQREREKKRIRLEKQSIDSGTMNLN